MGDQLRVGQVFEKTITVTESQAAEHLLAESLALFSTPELIRFIEMCALEGVRPFLQEGQDTVGTHVEVRHLAATPVGMQVTARTTLAASGSQETVRPHDGPASNRSWTGPPTPLNISNRRA